MQMRTFLTAAAVLLLASSAHAVVKSYDSSQTNGLPGDNIRASTNLCPPVSTSEGVLQGNTILEDDLAGSVSLDTSIQVTALTDLGPDQLVVTFGPGAFIFIDSRSSRTNNPPGGSVHASVGPTDSTAPGGAVEWGVVSGWSISGALFCVSSPVSICNQAGFAHGSTTLSALTSGTFNLNTWAFDTEGDYETLVPYVERTSNGGLVNTLYDMRGAFAGSTLPALPLIGFGALALSLAVIGGRSLLGKK